MHGVKDETTFARRRRGEGSLTRGNTEGRGVRRGRARLAEGSQLAEFGTQIACGAVAGG